MVHILNTIIPVFSIILLGLFIRSTGYLPAILTGPLNRLVYYIAIPAMIFRVIAEAPFRANFNALLLTGTLIATLGIFVLALIFGLIFSLKKEEMGTFLQSSMHGNLGYIGLAVAFYFLGKEGLTRASILAGFLMLLQNLLSVTGLQLFAKGDARKQRTSFVIQKIVGNPIILAALGGILFSLSGMTLPVILERSLSILSGMSLPLALLVIGASLSPGLIRSYLKLALSAGFLKLFVLPALGIAIYRWWGLSNEEFLPALILLAAPSATVTYVMAVEMKGSPEQASASVSTNTLLSSVAYIFWLGLIR